jgi:hypothetical protein
LDLPDEPALAALIGAHCVLVRPDQHVAWRGEAHAAAPESILRAAAGRPPLAEPAMGETTVARHGWATG